MPGERNFQPLSGICGAASLVGKEGTAVSITGSSNGVPVLTKTAAAAKPDGILLMGADVGKPCRFARLGVVNAKAGGVIAPAAEVEVDANGAFVTKASGTAVGKCLAGANTASGDIFPLFQY